MAKCWNLKYAGKPAGGLGQDGYISLKIMDRVYKAHRIAWAIFHGAWPTLSIDHIDGEPANNRIDNLREITHAQNMQNRSRQANNSSGITGVYWVKRERKWAAKLCLNGKSKSLGYWNSIEDAARAREKGLQEAGFSQRHGIERSKLTRWG